MPRKRRYRKGGSNLTFSLLRKELREGNLQSLFRGSTHTVPSTNAEPDPLLSSFVYNLPKANESASVELHSSVGPSSVKESSDEYYLERYEQWLSSFFIICYFHKPCILLCCWLVVTKRFAQSKTILMNL